MWKKALADISMRLVSLLLKTEAVSLMKQWNARTLFHLGMNMKEVL